MAATTTSPRRRGPSTIGKLRSGYSGPEKKISIMRPISTSAEQMKPTRLIASGFLGRAAPNAPEVVTR
jgi:hypothetical protein